MAHGETVTERQQLSGREPEQTPGDGDRGALAWAQLRVGHNLATEQPQILVHIYSGFRMSNIKTLFICIYLFQLVHQMSL